MNVSITKAANLAGISRTTLYNDINSGKITYISSGKNKKTIDISELERVYGSLNINDKKESSNVKTEQNLTTPKVGGSSDLVEIAVLREKLNMLETERKREREQFEERIEQMQNTLNKAQDNQTKTTVLLEHYTKDNKSAQWEDAFKTLENRMANQDDANQQQKAESEKIRKQNTALKRALNEEKSKGFFKRLFG